MNGDKENFHEEICQMGIDAEEAYANDFYGGPSLTDEIFGDITHLRRITDSYPHDEKWVMAVNSLDQYEDFCRAKGKRAMTYMTMELCR